MGLVFGATALVAIALATILVIVMRNEQRKLVARIEERDKRIEGLELRVEGAGREAADARERQRQAESDAAGIRAGAEANSERWKEDRAELEREMQALQDELDEAKSDEELLQARARDSLQRSEAPKLPAKRPDEACIDDKAVFRDSAKVSAFGNISAQSKFACEQIAAATLRARGTPISPTDHSASLDLLVAGRALSPGAGGGLAISIEVRVMTPFILTDLRSLRWLPCVTETELVIAADQARLDVLLEDRLKAAVNRAIERAVAGGANGILANQPLPTAPATPPPAGAGAGPGTTTQPAAPGAGAPPAAPSTAPAAPGAAPPNPGPP